MKNILIIEPGFQIYKEPIVRMLAESGDANLYFATGLGSSVPLEWVSPYAKGTFVFFYKKNDLIESVKRFEASQKVAFDGAMTYVETSVHHVNRLQHEMGWPVISTYTGKEVRSKAVMRKLFSEFGVAQPRFEIVGSGENPQRTLFPAIVKPAEMMSSLAVRKVTNPVEMLFAIDEAHTADFKGEDLRAIYGDISDDVLVEEFISGNEYSVETIVTNGEIKTLGITKKQTTTGHFFDETGHTFPAPDVDKNLLSRIQEMVERTHHALRLRNTVTHLEFKVQQDIPYVIELNCRIGGDVISELVRKSGTPGLGRLLVDIASGSPVKDFKVEKMESQSIRFFSTSARGRIAKLPTILHEESDVSVRFFASEGDMVDPGAYNSIHRIGYVSGPSSSVEAVYKRLDQQILIEESLGDLDVDGRSIAVVRAGSSDLADLVVVENMAWPNHTQAACAEVIGKRLAAKRGITLLAKDTANGCLWGFITFVISDSSPRATKSWVEYAAELLDSENFVLKNGVENFLFGISASVRDDAPAGIGVLLLASIRKIGMELGLSKAAYGGRLTCLQDRIDTGSSVETVYDELCEGVVKEPSIQIGLKAGFSPVALMENYFSDPASLDFGVLMISELCGGEKAGIDALVEPLWETMVVS